MRLPRLHRSARDPQPARGVTAFDHAARAAKRAAKPKRDRGLSGRCLNQQQNRPMGDHRSVFVMYAGCARVGADAARCVQRRGIKGVPACAIPESLSNETHCVLVVVPVDIDFILIGCGGRRERQGLRTMRRTGRNGVRSPPFLWQWSPERRCRAPQKSWWGKTAGSHPRSACGCTGRCS